jgi:cysteinyl-tRNA synthetase
MSLIIYNTLNKKREEFKPINKEKVGLYTCGPTVYWYPHIGNMKAYVNWDMLRKYLLYKGYKIKHVMNVTDVGHLTSDSDTGEDKMEKAALKEGKSAKEIAEFYFNSFKENMKKLNISEPNIWAKATDHIKEQINLVKKLEEKGFTYKTSDGIYFDTSKINDYGKLGNTNKEGLEEGKRIGLKEKRNNTDFALWKFSEKEGKRQQEWESPWGVGFPGWHLECSAMSVKYLGEQFDIHTGGQDHIQVHHTNEIAQTEAATGKKPWVNYWMHNAWLLFKGEKVSKSKGGLLTLPELEEKGFSGMDFRYFVLQTNYRKPLDFSLEGLEASKTAYNKLKSILSETKDDGKINGDYLEQFEGAMDDDLNTVKALQVLGKLVKDKSAKGKIRTVKEIDSVLSLDLLKFEKVKIPEEIKELIEKRDKARTEKNWNESDKIRDEIQEKGFLVIDTSEGTKVEKKLP